MVKYTNFYEHQPTVNQNLLSLTSTCIKLKNTNALNQLTNKRLKKRLLFRQSKYTAPSVGRGYKLKLKFYTFSDNYGVLKL